MCLSFMTFSLDGVNADGRWPAADGEKSIREALWNILATRPGERLMRPEFGVGLERYVHQPNTSTTRELIADRITRAIGRWEPRIDLDGVDVVSDETAPTRARVTIRYRIRETGALGELALALELGA